MLLRSRPHESPADGSSAATAGREDLTTAQGDFLAAAAVPAVDAGLSARASGGIHLL